MKLPWKHIASVALGVGGLFIPGLQVAVNTVEASLPELKGPQKKAAAVAIATTVVETIEGAAGKDILNDPMVMAATASAVDAIVSLQNAIAAAEHAKNPAMPAMVPAA